MAKPRSPLLSLGARGTIADTLTFQKRGRLTIARRKPIPTDPKSPLQLAQRQVYRDAVAAWNALSPAEKEAYRGVCPGLTPYQCYMKTALIYVPPVPPPEEKTHQQTEYDSENMTYGATTWRHGQRLPISNRKVTKLAFHIRREGSPTGDVVMAIRRVSDNSPIFSKVWGDASGLPLSHAWEEVEFDDPQVINEEVRAYLEFTGGNASNYVGAHRILSDVKAGEYITYQWNATWSDDETFDCTYRYKYYEV